MGKQVERTQSSALHCSGGDHDQFFNLDGLKSLKSLALKCHIVRLAETGEMTHKY